MKVLLLVQAEQRIILDRLYEGIAAHCECDIRRLSNDEQDSLKKYFARHVDVHRYDRIVFFLRFKKEIRQVSFIRTIPNVVFLEHDAYQNYIPGKYKGVFSKHYRHLPWARVLSSGFGVASRLQSEGVDAVFVPKGYDHSLLTNAQGERDIELAFVGSTKSGAYHGRKEMLGALSRLEPLQVMRTSSGSEYVQTLNRIRFFASADVGMGEYMIKNFEAMACGCILFTYDQGAQENQALGFVDMQNVVLYRSVEEFREKLKRLRTDSVLASRIAEQGCDLAERRFRFFDLGRQIVLAMQAPLRKAQYERRWGKIRGFLGV